VAVRYADPRVLAVQVWQDHDILYDKPCADAADVATEADRLLDNCCAPAERSLHSSADG
jgi:hypothetical protein